MIKAYLLSGTRLRIRGENDQAFKDLLKIWTDKGGDVALGPAGAIDLLGDIPSFWSLADKISADSRLFPLSEMIISRLENVEIKNWEIPMPRADTLLVSDRPLVMGIINVTPDSFSDGGKNFDRDKAVKSAFRLVDEGADILDIGGESTRPGAQEVPVDEEIRRTVPVVEKLAGKVSVPISIDTRKSAVAEAALKVGASIVNDVSMLGHDPYLADICARYGAPLVISHIQGTPATMQNNPHYNDLLPEIIDALGQAIETAEERGVSSKSIILDPGIGFGKKLEHNLAILNGLYALTGLGKPIMIGPSRKRFIGDILKVSTDQRLEGTISTCVLALLRGAKIFRVHDVKENRRALDVAHAIITQKPF